MFTCDFHVFYSFYFGPAEFIDMSVDERDIVVDVKVGQTTVVKDFLTETCQQHFKRYNIGIDGYVFFVEQKQTPVFSGKRRAGLCFFPDSDDEIAQKLFIKTTSVVLHVPNAVV